MPWEFARGRRELKIRTTAPLVVNNGRLALAAVRAGVGLAYILEEDVIDDIAQGRLVRVLVDWAWMCPGPHFYHLSRRQTPIALQALIAALRSTKAPAKVGPA